MGLLWGPIVLVVLVFLGWLWGRWCDKLGPYEMQWRAKQLLPVLDAVEPTLEGPERDYAERAAMKAMLEGESHVVISVRGRTQVIEIPRFSAREVLAATLRERCAPGEMS